MDSSSIVEFFRKKDYEMINDHLGSGAFGRTVLLKDPFIDELFVAKKYEPYYEEDKEVFFGSFLQEIKIMYKLNHRNVVRIYNYYAYPDQYTGYILMEYIEGRNIYHFFSSYYPWLEMPSPDDIFEQLIDGFCYIESQGIIHRDIREGNIMIDKNGLVKIIDFGLGKTFKPIADTSEDSLRSEINRSGLDCLPDEYYEGRYTSKTDMFYLAEMYRRILRKTDNMDSFSYESILQKMLNPSENRRYSSFADIKEEIHKREFHLLDISNKDKEIYRHFTNSIYDFIACYTSNEKVFAQNVGDVETGLRDILTDNCFEDIIQNPCDLINVFIKHPYKYYKNKKIIYELIADFYKWYISLSTEFKTRVLNNFVVKLSSIPTKIDDEELPF